MQQKLHWSGYTNTDRLMVIEQVKHTISDSGGCIVNFNMYSDLALSLTIEVEEDQIIPLHQQLRTILTVSDLSDGNIKPNSKEEWLLFVNISFGQGKGELKNEVPAVPG